MMINIGHFYTFPWAKSTYGGLHFNWCHQKVRVAWSLAFRNQKVLRYHFLTLFCSRVAERKPTCKFNPGKSKFNVCKTKHSRGNLVQRHFINQLKQVFLNNIIKTILLIVFKRSKSKFPYGLVVRIRRSHRRGPGSIPGVGKLCFPSSKFFSCSKSPRSQEMIISHLPGLLRSNTKNSEQLDVKVWSHNFPVSIRSERSSHSKRWTHQTRTEKNTD